MKNAQVLLDNWPLLLPLLILELGLMIAAVIHVLRHPHYRFGNKVMWLIVVIVFEIIGPVIYFAFGRGKNE